MSIIVQEIDMRRCKACGEFKERIMSGKFDTYNKRFKDTEGKYWNGNVCPACHKEIQRKLQKLRRDVKQGV